MVLAPVWTLGVLTAQTPLYDPATVHEIRISIPQPGWRQILDSLMKAGDDTTRIAGNVRVDGKWYNGAGIRFKGFSSWNEGEIKNPFNIELDYLISNKNHQGYKKIRLSNVIHDPSFVREALSYRIARDYLPASEAVFANLWVNDTLIGLYSHVESVDDVFIRKQFGDEEGILIKGSPQKLVFPFGQNANLAFLSNTDSLAYAPYYELQSEYGWEALMRFINILNNYPDSIPYVLNADRALWMHAFNYALVNLDSYLGYAQNYYLAMDKSGRFNTIPWDLNMSFGSFRSSDGSTHFNGLTIPQAKVLDPLQHLSFSITPRPLITQLLKDSTWRRMYMAHLRTIMTRWIQSGKYLQVAAEYRTLIDSCVLADTNKFYTYNHFIQNIDTTVGGSGGMIQYVGIKELMEARLDYLKTVPGYAGAPEIKMDGIIPLPPVVGDTVWLYAGVPGNVEVYVFAKQSDLGRYQKYKMYDDGVHHDGMAGDNIYGAGIMMTGNVLKYYFYAQNDSAGVFFPENAEQDFFVYYPLAAKDSLVINEIAGETVLLPGEIPTFAYTWVELFNRSMDTLSTENLYLADDTTGSAGMSLNRVLIPPGGYRVFTRGASAATQVMYPYLNDVQAGWVGLSDMLLSKMVDSAWVPAMAGGFTWGRYPNGNGPFVLMEGTPGSRNQTGIQYTADIQLYPNPASESAVAVWTGVGGIYNLDLIDLTHRNVFNVQGEDFGNGKTMVAELPLNHLASGTYLVSVTYSGVRFQQKLIVY